MHLVLKNIFEEQTRTWGVQLSGDARWNCLIVYLPTKF